MLVDSNGNVKLSDFGASKKIQEKTIGEGDAMLQENKSLKGSPYWMAPEIILRSGHGKPVDVWSLGCCVIEMLTGSPPWASISK